MVEKRIVLQVWIGAEPSDEIKDMMRKTAKMPGYLLISNQNFIGAKNQKSAIKYTKRPKVSEYATAVRKQDFSEELKNTMISDFIRFHFCTEHENVMYLDCDCIIKKEPVIRGDGPFFVGTASKNIVDYYAFFSKKTTFFIEIIDVILKKLDYTKPYFQMFYNAINSRDELPRRMNRTCFEHRLIGAWSK